MDHTQRTIQGDPPPATSAVSTQAMPNVMFREIHKNAFLKRHSSDRRTGFPRRTDRVWVVFCVHDDNEAFLEIYQDQKLALTHKPEWFASLANALHVSPSICGHEDEFEFAVTLTSQVVRLAAPSWDLMMEWVDTIRNKLRELKVLSPKENVYSRMPEPKQPLLPTRDPNSPLPLPPQGPSTILPGVEPVHGEASVVAEEPVRHQRENAAQRSGNDAGERRGSRSHQANGVGEGSGQGGRAQRGPQECVNGEGPSEQGEGEGEAQAKPRLRLSRAVSVPESPVPHSSHLVTPPVAADANVTVIEVPSSRGSHSASECGFFNFQISDEVIHMDAEIEDVFFTPPVTPRPVVTVGETHYEHVFFPTPRNVAEVKVSGPGAASHVSSVTVTPPSTDPSQPSTSAPLSAPKPPKPVIVSLAVVPEPEPEVQESDTAGNISLQTQAKLEKVNTTGLIPRVPSKSAKHEVPRKVSKDAVHVPQERLETQPSSSSPSTSHQVDPLPSTEVVEHRREESKAQPSTSASPQYSQVKKIPKPKQEVAVKSQEATEAAQVASPVPSRRRINEVKRTQGEKKPEVLPRTTSNKTQTATETPQPNEEVPRGPKKSGNSEAAPGGSRSEAKQNSHRESPSTAPSTSAEVERKKERVPCNNNVDTEPLTASVQPSVGVINVQDIPLIGGHQRRRRRSSSSDAAPVTAVPPTRGLSGADRIRVNPPPAAGREASQRSEAEQNSHVNLASQGSARMTLREQQVMQLRREMVHPGGVRLQLRRKDCVGSIALVDALGGVWVAGWKQKEHPMLYNALHIGDQLISVGDVVVRSSSDAHKLLRSSSSLYIEFIIRRVPFGKVLALRRSSEGQSLGIVQEGNSAEIRDVLANSVAARHGLPPKTPSCDGLSLTNWFLTEINGRPLNLFFKDNEVRDRLNAVGKEISILVQPHDFIKQIKKQLKSIRSYKDYIVQ